MAPKTTEYFSQQTDDIDADDFPDRPNRLRIILSRATLVYLAMFLGAGIVLSMFGINPLIHNGALPKCLLVFVGVALILALANSEVNLVEEQTRSWLTLTAHRPFKKR